MSDRLKNTNENFNAAEGSKVPAEGDKNDLLPCPFCGGNAWIDTDNKNLVVKCRGIGCYTQMTVVTDDRAAAVKKWNERAR